MEWTIGCDKGHRTSGRNSNMPHKCPKCVDRTLEEVIRDSARMVIPQFKDLIAERPDIIAKAVRFWIKERLPKEKKADKYTDLTKWGEGYNQALKDVGQSLGAE